MSCGGNCGNSCCSTDGHDHDHVHMDTLTAFNARVSRTTEAKANYEREFNRELNMAAPTVSITSVRNGDVETLLTIAYAVKPTQFVAAFNNVGVAIDENNIANDIKALANMSNTGTDLTQGVRRPSGSIVKFSVKDILNTILVSNAEIVTALNNKKITIVS